MVKASKDSNYTIQFLIHRNKELFKEHTETHYLFFIKELVDTINSFMRTILGVFIVVFTLAAEFCLILQKKWVRVPDTNIIDEWYESQIEREDDKKSTRMS